MTDPNPMLERLAASGPDPAHREGMMLFGRLLGSWRLEMTGYPEDGPPRRFVGEWHFGWTLQGRTVQDVLITRTPEGEVVGYGSTVRSFDASTGRWWIVWQDPLAGEFSVLLAEPEGDRIVLQGQWTIANLPGPFRWVFSDITPQTFHWQAEVGDASGGWRRVEEFRATRM